MDTSFDSKELQAFPLFAGMEAPLLERLLHQHGILTIPAAHQLVFEGDWGDGLFLIRSGVAKVRHITLGGGEVVVALLGVGEMVGELAMLLGNNRRSADVVALTPMEVVKLRWSAVREDLERWPDFALTLAQLEARRLVALGQRFRLRGEDATTRVLGTLAELARSTSYAADPLSPIPDLTQTEIATIAGLARGTTSKVLSQLRGKAVLVDCPEGMRIVTLDPLRKRGLIEG
jgi:CRP-like cAMP-binding protein